MDDLWFRRAREQAPLADAVGAFHGGLVVHLAHRLYGEFRLRDEVSRLAIESITLGVLAEASRRAAREPGRVGAVGPALADSRTAVRRRAFCRAAGHRDRRDARRRASGSPCAHVPARLPHDVCRLRARGADRVRAARARRRRALRCAEIAAAAGFCDQSHFSRLFKRYTGMSPAEYRLAVRPR